MMLASGVLGGTKAPSEVPPWSTFRQVRLVSVGREEPVRHRGRDDVTADADVCGVYLGVLNRLALAERSGFGLL